MEKQTENRSSVQKHKVHFYRQIAFTFIGAAIVVLGGIVYFSLSQAVIRVTPRVEQVQSDFNVLLKTDTDQTEEGLKATLVFTTVSVENSSPAELVEAGEDQPATGQVTMKNTSKTPQSLIATTRLLAEDGTLFRLKKEVVVPANGDVTADVYADKPGVAGEIAASRFTIPGLNQARQQEVYAESTEAMTGGTKAVYKITQNLIDETVKKAKDRLIEDAKAKIIDEKEVTDADFLEEISLVSVTKESVEPEADTNANEVVAQIEATVVFILAKRDDVFALANNRLFAGDSIGYELSSSNEGSFQYSLENFDAEQGKAQLRIKLEGSRRITSNYPALNKANMVGKNASDLKTELEADEAIETVDISLRPFWLRSVPRLVDHVYVQFE